MRRIGAILTAFAFSLAGAFAISSPAQAASSDCFNGKFCLWQDIQYGGPLGMYSPSTTCYTMGVMNNAASSFYNRTGRTVRFYDGSSCTGDTSSVSCCFQDADLRFYGVGGVNWNDRITSFKLV